jgi:2-hydroxychromene-2-carboxylate isomerase
MTELKEAVIDFYFDFVSPFGWIAAEQIGTLARKHGRTVRWHPFLLKVAVVDTMGLRPILKTPLKGTYSWYDAKRSAALQGLTISPDVKQVFSPVPAARAIIWARDRKPDVEALVLGLYRRHWHDGGDISEDGDVLAVAGALGYDTAALKDGLADPAIKQAFHAEVEAAIDRGVFGSPTTIVDGEPFWGADRLDQVERWMTGGPDGWATVTGWRSQR